MIAYFKYDGKLFYYEQCRKGDERPAPKNARTAQIKTSFCPKY